MFGHFVPQVYQKSWHTAIGKKNVFYFNKNDLSSPIHNLGGNISNNLGVEDLYIFDSVDNGNGVTANGNELEDNFNTKIEYYWNNTLSELNELLNTCESQEKKVIAIRKADIPASLTVNLISFIVMQYFRIKKNFETADNGFVQIILAICRDEYAERMGISPTELPDLQNDKDFYNSVWKSILLDCFDKRDSILDVVSKKIMDSCSITIFYSNRNNPELILSDNPVIWNAYVKKPIEKLESGIFMPINPYVLIGLLNYGSDRNIQNGDYVFVKSTSDFFKYINSVLVQQADKIVGFCNSNIENMISDSVDVSLEWNSMFQ